MVFFFYFTMINTTQIDTWSDICKPCDIDLQALFSWSSDFAYTLKNFHGQVI